MAFRGSLPLWMRLRGSFKTSAADVLRVTRQSPEPPVDPLDIAAVLGIQVLIDEDLSGTGVSGYARTHPDGLAEVFLDEGEPWRRMRFTLAHEIGHVMMHPVGVEFRDTRETMSGRAKLNRKREYQANRFAAELLMPAFMVKAVMRDSVLTLDDLADVFEVSRSAMRIRLDTLAGAFQQRA